MRHCVGKPTEGIARMGFSDTVRQDTRVDHEQAERSAFIVSLLGGELDKRAHVELLKALHPVYRELERSLVEQSGQPSIDLFDDRRLDRCERIADDLRTYGVDADTEGSLSASRAYVELIHDAAQSPQRLLAHHYTRYLGDMAGGRVIASRLASQYGIEPSALTYYDFSGLDDVHAYRKQYKVHLDEAAWTEAERAEFIEESRRAYRANSELFADLANALAMPA